MKNATLALIVIATVALIGCGRKSEQNNASTPASAALPADLVVAELPGEAQAPAVARRTAKAGDEVLLTGHIAGRKQPFVEGRAMFTIVGSDIAMCGDECAVPWDLCCSPTEAISAHAATIQLVNDQSQPVKASLNGHQGLAPGKQVVVRGTVHQADEHAFVVNLSKVAVVNATKK